MHNILYKTTCLSTSKFYGGKHVTKNLDDGYLGSGLILRRAIKKHGRQNFKREIIFIAEDLEMLELAEELFIDQRMLDDPLCMNLALGGQGGIGPALCKSTESHKLSTQKAGLKTRGRTKENHAGRKTQAEKISVALKGRKLKPSKIVERSIFQKSTPVGDLNPLSKLTDLQRIEIFHLSFLMTARKIQMLYPAMTISGIKTSIQRVKMRKLLTQ